MGNFVDALLAATSMCRPEYKRGNTRMPSGVWLAGMITCICTTGQSPAPEVCRRV